MSMGSVPSFQYLQFISSVAQRFLFLPWLIYCLFIFEVTVNGRIKDSFPDFIFNLRGIIMKEGYWFECVCWVFCSFLKVSVTQAFPGGDTQTFMYRSPVSANTESLTPSFFFCIHFTPFSCCVCQLRLQASHWVGVETVETFVL